MTLLKWALIFLIVSLIAAFFGFTGISAASADIARVLFFIFLVIFVVLLVLGLMAVAGCEDAGVGFGEERRAAVIAHCRRPAHSEGALRDSPPFARPGAGEAA